MILDIDSILKRNYQRVSTNRFVVDSPRFWRREFHPRFKDIFTFAEIQEVCAAANEHLSFKLDATFIDTVALKIYEWFSGHRFADIPTKNPQSTGMFLSDLYFALLDYLPQISFTDYPLDEDDFNVVGHKAETGKNDTSKVATNETSKQATKQETQADILSNGELKQTSTASTENVDEETDQNTKQTTDVFLSPQNQGVTPNIVSEKHKGVDGVTLNPGGSFTTNTSNGVLGDSVKNKSNTSAQAQQAEQALQQNNDMRSTHETNGELQAAQEQENTTQKNDNYTEQLSFDRSSKLLDYYELNNDRLWFEILSRLSRWILQIDIATGERNYIDCPEYE